MVNYYTDEPTTQVVIALLKKHGIRRIIASPGTTNMSLVGSMQGDPYFQMYSSVDERSAAYMACGLAAASGEPVVISCTGATASRNYMPGLTEAFYRKLPVLAITSSQIISRVGHHIAQVLDRSVMPNDVVKLSLTLPIVKDHDDFLECTVKTNQAILELTRRGGGPVHINLPTVYSQSFDTKELPKVRIINRVDLNGEFPPLPEGKIAIFIGSHAVMSEQETEAIDAFCASNDAVVFCDQTSGYNGRYRIQYALVAGQQMDLSIHRPDLLIYIGEISGDYYSLTMSRKQEWRVSADGELRDTFRSLRYVFEMPEIVFFQHYSNSHIAKADSYLSFCKKQLNEIRSQIPELPFSNPWIASKMAHRIPSGSVIHFGILNSLRTWSFFDLPASVESAANVGGFGIDGCISALLGASLANKGRLHFGVVGDLAAFYDMNALGNRHVGENLRILLVNNGKGTEFRQYSHPAVLFGEDADEYIAAAGHFGCKSRLLIKHYAEDLGFEYLSATNKQQFEEVIERFTFEEITDCPMVLEVFTNSEEESAALESILSIKGNEKKENLNPHEGSDSTLKVKRMVKQVLGDKGVKALKAIVKR